MILIGDSEVLKKREPGIEESRLLPVMLRGNMIHLGRLAAGHPDLSLRIDLQVEVVGQREQVCGLERLTQKSLQSGGSGGNRQILGDILCPVVIKATESLLSLDDDRSDDHLDQIGLSALIGSQNQLGKRLLRQAGAESIKESDTFIDGGNFIHVRVIRNKPRQVNLHSSYVSSQ